MWIDIYGDEDPPEVTLNIYFLGQADRPELARISDETAEVRWFSPRTFLWTDWRLPTSNRPSAAGLK